MSSKSRQRAKSSWWNLKKSKIGIRAKNRQKYQFFAQLKWKLSDTINLASGCCNWRYLLFNEWWIRFIAFVVRENEMLKNGTSEPFFTTSIFQRVFRYEFLCSALQPAQFDNLHCFSYLLKSWVRHRCLGSYLGVVLKMSSRKKNHVFNFFQLDENWLKTCWIHGM